MLEIDEMYMELKRMGYLEYGKYIPAKVIAGLIGKEFKFGDWDFIGKFLQLKEYIEDRGYFCTSRGAGNGALRILHAKEWSKKLDNLNKNVLRKQKRAINTMRNVGLDDLDEKEQKILNHVQNKLNMGLQAMRSVLYDI